MVRDNLQALYEKLPSAVKLVAVSKFHPVERLMEAYDAGQRVFAESRPQELAAKVPQMPADIEWHFIGHLQTNKLKLVLPYVSLVQSVDSFHLLEAIDKWGRENGRVIDVLLELHLGAEETKQGFDEEDILRCCGSTPSENLRSQSDLRPSHGEPWAPPSHVPRVAQFSEGVLPPLENIRIRGLMGMATNTEDEAVIEADFARIESLFHRIREAFPSLRETFTELSIGMSNDWTIATRHGATMVRIGTDIFGPREY
ncbi:MAG: YggS family pyridoxal phosphate enzyme [Bacteroidales bacterium]|nr:YggS family pyridoxal phosphate enzyme [Bacteroidales bacterium]